jgi:hypothetical protein
MAGGSRGLTPELLPDPTVDVEGACLLRLFSCDDDEEGVLIDTGKGTSGLGFIVHSLRSLLPPFRPVESVDLDRPEDVIVGGASLSLG